MNKFMALLAVVTCASVAAAMKEIQNEELSELSISTSDSEEIADVKPEYRVFESFCLESRDEIVTLLNSKVTDAKSASMYAILLGNADDLQRELLKVDGETIEEGRRIIMEAAVAPASKSPEDIAKSVDETVHKASAAEIAISAVKSVMSAMLETLQSDVFKKIRMLDGKFSPQELKAMFEETCKSIDTDIYNPIREKFDELKKSLDKTESYKYSRATVGNIGCLTSERLAKAGSVCMVYKMIGPHLFEITKIFGF